MKLSSKLKIALKSLLSVSLSEVETDKATLIFDGELAEGIEVFVKDEESEDGVKPAEDGTYETETQLIEVADGKIVKISEKTEEEPEAEQVEAAEDEPADEPEADANEPSLEDRIAALESLSGEIRGALEQLLNAIASLEGRLEAVEEKVAKLDNEPADEPADDDVNPEQEEQHSRISYLRKINK